MNSSRAEYRATAPPIEDYQHPAFQAILQQAKALQGVSVILVDESTAFLDGATGGEYQIIDQYCARVQVRCSEQMRQERDSVIFVTHSPFVCRVADLLFKYFTRREHYLPNGLITDEITLNRIKYANVLDAYGTGLF